jgi:hypothetical protein
MSITEQAASPRQSESSSLFSRPSPCHVPPPLQSAGTGHEDSQHQATDAIAGHGRTLDAAQGHEATPDDRPRAAAPALQVHVLSGRARPLPWRAVPATAGLGLLLAGGYRVLLAVGRRAPCTCCTRASWQRDYNGHVYESASEITLL